MILGLDVSTSCTGWCIINSSGSLIEMGYIDLSKCSNVYSKAEKVEDELTSIANNFSVEKVFIEENLQAFRPGLSSAKTLLTLARFNGIVSLLSYKIFNFEPMHLNVNSARKSLGIKIIRGKKSEKSTKEQVLDWVDSELKNFNWPVKILKSGPRKGQTILEAGCYDMADAYVISRSGIVFEQ